MKLRLRDVVFGVAYAAFITSFALPVHDDGPGDANALGIHAAYSAFRMIADAVESMVVGPSGYISGWSMALYGIGTFANLAMIAAAATYFGRKHWLKQWVVYLIAPFAISPWTYLVTFADERLFVGFYVWAISVTVITAVLIHRYRKPIPPWPVG